MGRVLLVMKGKKLLIALFAIIFVNACSSPTALLGPVYTLSNTGNVLQASLSYGSNEMITMYTGKTPLENLQELSSAEQNKRKNIHKKTLESEDFYILVKQNVEKTNKILKSSNQ